MIRVKRPARSVPDSLKASTERRRAAEHLKHNGTLDGFTFRDYGQDDVKLALRQLFRGKCAYCETQLARQPIEVEHYRPKGGVMIGGGLQKPGYWWLAADWDNLLPACIDCNRRRRQEIVDGSVRMSGKENHFPLAPAAGRTPRRGDERREAPLLLNPCHDEPDRHLDFPLAAEGQVTPRLVDGRPDPRGEESIRTYGLDAFALTQERKRTWGHLQRYVRGAGRCLQWLRTATGEEERRDILAQLTDEKEGLESMIQPDAPYLAMVRPIAEAVLAQIRAVLPDRAASPRSGLP